MREFEKLQANKILDCYIEKGRKAVPIGTKSKDGNFIRTSKGWQYIKKESEYKIGDVKTYSNGQQFIKTENGWQYIKKKDKAAIKPVNDQEAQEIIDTATPESRINAGLELFGKSEDEKSVGEEIENMDIQEPQIKEITARSGEKIQALDYSYIQQKDIQLVDQKGILDKEKPTWVPDINEKFFYGYNDDQFLFDYVKLNDDQLLLALNDGFSINKNLDRVSNEDLKNDIKDLSYLDKKRVSLNKDYEKGSAVITLNNKKYHYEDSKQAEKDARAIFNNQEVDYAVVSIDQLVAIQDYYTKHRKEEIKREKEVKTQEAIERIRGWSESMKKMYYPLDYKRLSEKQRKKYTNEEWDKLSDDEKLQEVPFMKYPAVRLPTAKRVKQLSADTMRRSTFRMFKQFVDKNYELPERRGYTENDPAYKEYNEVREAIQWKQLDLNIQREENLESYKKGFETSFGEKNATDELLKDYGVKIKSQSGRELMPGEIEQIKNNLNHVYTSFGNRSEMSRKFGLKISHAGEKMMFARRALGIYIPSMKTIGVSSTPKYNKFGFTLAHEFAHFIDNYAGGKAGRNFASDDYNSTAGQIANKFRSLMNGGSRADTSNYMNRTCECFARAMEQYHAIKTEGDGAGFNDKPYYEIEGHVNERHFKETIKPLIDKFLSDNNEILKSLINEL